MLFNQPVLLIVICYRCVCRRPGADGCPERRDGIIPHLVEPIRLRLKSGHQVGCDAHAKQLQVCKRSMDRSIGLAIGLHPSSRPTCCSCSCSCTHARRLFPVDWPPTRATPTTGDRPHHHHLCSPQYITTQRNATQRTRFLSFCSSRSVATRRTPPLRFSSLTVK
jgi:hypothetical protein